jgi:hypothetical protein
MGIIILTHCFFYKHCSTDFIGGYSCLTPSGLEMVVDVPTQNGLNVNSGTLAWGVIAFPD